MSWNYYMGNSLHRLKPTLEGAQEQANRSGKNIQSPQQPDLPLKTYLCSTTYFVVLKLYHGLMAYIQSMIFTHNNRIR